MKRFLFYGAPGVGKSTFAKILGEKFGLIHISMGDVLRKEVSSGSALGQSLQSTIAKGNLVDDAVCVQLLAKPFRDAQRVGCGYILDGYPRSLDQIAGFVDNTADEHFPQRVMQITLNRDVATAKLIGRRHCAECGTSFNVADVRHDDYDMPPILPTSELCPRNHDPAVCSARLMKRDDDTEDTIRARFRVYDEMTEPVIDFFHHRGIAKDFEVKKGIADWERLWEEMSDEGSTTHIRIERK